MMYYIDTDKLMDGEKTQCPRCAANGGDKSHDNFHFYSASEGGYCWACKFTIPSKEYVDLGKKGGADATTILQKDIDSLANKSLTQEQINTIHKNTVESISVKYRGLNSEVCKRLGVRWEVDKDGKVEAMFFPVIIRDNGEDKLVGYKVRRIPKEFFTLGYVGKLAGFFNKKDSVAKKLLVVSGECFTEDTEVMTERGFVRFPDLTDEDKVLQVNEDMVGSYVKPLARIKKQYEGELIYQKTSTTNSLTTPNHNVVFRDSFGKVFKQKASERVKTNWTIPKSVVVDGEGIGLSADEIKLVIAICADGSLRHRVKGNNAVHFGFMKKRKIERLGGILQRLGINYSSYVNTYKNGKTYTTFNFTLPDYVDSKELPKSWLVKATLAERLFILEEIRYWDGFYDENRKTTEFTSKDYDEVSYIQQMAHTSGMYASTAHRKNKFGEWYRCTISGSKLNTTTQSHKTNKVGHKGYVYCVTVPTGMILTRHEGKIVVNGNCDLITAIFALENSDKYRKDYNIVSPTTGEGSIANTIKLNYDWVDAHEQIIICTDMDDAGDESFEAVKAVVDNSKLFRAKLRHKDLNDYLKNGDGDKIANDLYWSPVPVSTFGIANSGDIFKEMLATVALERVKLPPFLSDLDEVFNGGISLNEIISLVAPPSGGKTAVINQWILDWLMTSPYKVFVIPFEDSMASYGMKIASKVCGVNIQALRTAEERLAVIEKNKDEINKYLYNDDMTHRFNIMETIPSDIDELKKSILQAIKVNGSQIIVIDPLSALLSKMSNEQQVDFMAFQESLKREYAVTIINCLHVRKSGSGQAANSEGASYSEEDIRGSSAISGTATINILLNRNKMAECDIERNTTTISVSKNRTNGNTGRNLAKIYYSPEHSTLFSYSYAEKNGFFKGVTAEGLKKILDEEKATTVLDDSFKREVDESMNVF